MRASYLLFVLVYLAGCSTDDAAKHPIASVASTNLPTAATQSVPAANSPEQAVRDYLNWYSANYNKLPTNFIKTVGGNDTLGYYAVNSQVTENWLAAVQKSNLVSATFLQNWRSYFKQYADTLRLHPQNDGPPSGFDYDFLMLSQEADTKLTELQAGTFTTKLLNPARAVVAALGPQHDGWREGMTFTLAKSAAGKWQIDAVSIPENLIQ
ncbi:hypothetical protein FNT36_19255 [Hymenobacter setariae]|uniref:DUF3828 domain-containing protein n=1 Tax=Hymenobacter setariae TaxID=2594794 RepID=A0A558BPB4_9BACT|nr:hypothetical protein [Hymenobacter setariae]TVT38338.1 hypothetical protein FNT36_19255 [Hymenobacter setariae]